MTSVSMFEAKTNLSKYVPSVESGQEPFVIIVRNGTPVAKIVPYDSDTGRRIGPAKGKIPELTSIEKFNSIDVAVDFNSDRGLI